MQNFNKLKTRFVQSPVAKPLPVVVAIKTTTSEALDRSFTTAAIQTSEQEA